MHLQTLVVVGLLSVSLALSGCLPKTKPEDAGKEMVNDCAGSELDSNAVLYFGPSNQLGPGSIWSRLGPQGGYQPQWRMEDLGIDSSVIARGATFQCSLSRNSQLAANAQLSVLSAAANVSAEAKADFSRAQKVDVSVTNAAWDTIWAGPYIARLRSVENPDIRADVLGENRLVLRRALRLDGYKVVLDFDAQAKPGIKARYAGKTLAAGTVGEVGAELSATWTEDDRLELTAGGEIYVAGEFGQLVHGNLVSTKGGFTPVDLGDKTIVPFQPK